MDKNSYPNLGMQDKVVFVTGSGNGIGRGIALCLAEHGARVAIAEIDPVSAKQVAAEIEAMGGQVLVHNIDVSNHDELISALKNTRQHFGQLDVIVNNALLARMEPLAEIAEENLDQMLAVGLKPLFWTAQVAESLLSDNGSIIQLCSPVALLGVPGTAAYTAIKGAVAALTRQLATELAPNIRINAVLPGAVPSLANSDPVRLAKHKERIPLQRLGTPRDIANAVVFLSSPLASYITGHILTVDGGISIAG